MAEIDKISFIKTTSDKQVDVSSVYGNSIIHVHDASSGGKKQKDTLFIGDCQISDVYNTSAEDSWTTEKIGGLSATSAATMKNKTVSEVLDMILYPTKQPTKTDPSVTLSYNGTLGSIIKVGTKLPALDDFSASCYRGSLTYKNANGDYYYAGEPGEKNITINGGNSLWETSATEGSYAFKCVVKFANGAQPKDNKGNVASLSAYSSADVTSNIITIVSVYPVYANTSSITSMTEQSLLNYNSSVSFDITIPAEIDGTLDKFQLSLPSGVSLSSVLKFNSVSGAYDINVSMVTNGTETRNGITYNKYIRTKTVSNTVGSASYRITIVKS